ncbi:MAG: hypothetical protein DI630_14120 [Gordonia sp. (in: high G+C Gram-positive bacteria)]|nr:MAG: hypothetical protein DI630_14120 [Gordonia sp. (in: high G+C Gram-positive bacteria)]
MWWFISMGVVAWLAVSIAAASVVARIISHADLEDDATRLRQDEHQRSAGRGCRMRWQVGPEI